VSNQRLADLFNPELAADACREMADAAGAFMTDRAQANAPVQAAGVGVPNRRPGTLRDSIRQLPVSPVHTDGPDSGYQSGAGTADPIAHLIEHGVAAHDIAPRRGKALTFRTTSGEVARAVIRHPGFPGRYFMLKAVEETRVAFPVVAQPALTRWAKRQVRAARRR
jgi:hypothetical protein